MIFNKAGTVIVSTIVLFSIILVYTPDELTIQLQLIFLLFIFIFSFCLDGANNNGFIMLVAMILKIKFLHLEENSYLLFIISIPLFTRIGLVLDVLNTATISTIITSQGKRIR